MVLPNPNPIPTHTPSNKTIREIPRLACVGSVCSSLSHPSRMSQPRLFDKTETSKHTCRPTDYLRYIAQNLVYITTTRPTDLSFDRPRYYTATYYTILYGIVLHVTEDNIMNQQNSHTHRNDKQKTKKRHQRKMGRAHPPLSQLTVKLKPTAKSAY